MMVKIVYCIIKGRYILAAVFCCAALFAATLGSTSFFNARSVAAGASITNWGLSFRQPGQVPQGNASAEYLRQYDAYYVDTRGQKTIYLTFDAGFENGCTPKILDVLKKHDVKAAFFLVGNYLNRNPELVRRMVEEGHIVGNHTYHHPDMSKISGMNNFKKELQSLEELYEQITGGKMQKFYRPPQGKFSESNLKMAKELGYKTVFWSLAYVDWYEDNQPSREEALGKLVPRIHPGAVVLLHSTSKTNAAILDELLAKWKSEGYRFESIDKLV